MLLVDCFFFFKQKTAYDMRISDWSSDVCSSDLHARVQLAKPNYMGDRPEAENRLEQARPLSSREQWLGRNHRVEIPHELPRRKRAGPGIRRERSEERRVGQEWVRQVRSRWTPSH